jgi:hypothetical protein
MAEATMLINKLGCHGRPVATVLVDPGVPTDVLAGLVQKNLTRNKDLLKKLGLKACLSCISGMDIDIRQRYDIDMRVQF